MQGLSVAERFAVRQCRSKPLWEEKHVWLQLERQRVPNDSGIAGAIDYSLNHWAALTANLRDGTCQWTTARWPCITGARADSA